MLLSVRLSSRVRNFLKIRPDYAKFNISFGNHKAKFKKTYIKYYVGFIHYLQEEFYKFPSSAQRYV